MSVTRDPETLPSAWLPQGGVRCPRQYVDGVRAFVDADIVWDDDAACFVVLEWCENPDRWATVNGRKLQGWRRAYHHRNPVTEESFPLRDTRNGKSIVDAVRFRDVSQYGERENEQWNRYLGRADEEEVRAEEAPWEASRERALDHAREFRKMTFSERLRHAREIERKAEKQREGWKRKGVLV